MMCNKRLNNMSEMSSKIVFSIELDKEDDYWLQLKMKLIDFRDFMLYLIL